MKKIFLIMLLGFLLIGNVMAYDLGEIANGNCIDLYQYCDSCTYVNLTTVKLSNGTNLYYNTWMTKTGYDYTYKFCLTTEAGEYSYTTCGNPDGTEDCESFTFGVRQKGQGDFSDVAMAIIFLGVGYFVFRLIYRMNKFIGNMAFLIMGASIIFLFLRSGETLMIYLGVMISLFSAVKLIYDLLRKP